MTEASIATQVWEAAKLAGPFGTMLALGILYKVNQERVKYRDERDALLREVLDTFNAGTTASRDMSQARSNFFRGKYAGPTFLEGPDA